MLAKRMEEALNGQVKNELYSGYLYLAMSAYCASQGIPGATHWFMAQAQEESAHAMKLYDYIQQKGGKVVLLPIDAPPAEFGSLLEMYQVVLKHEEGVTANFNDLMEIALEERDHATRIFLEWFVSEQVEEEAQTRDIIDQLKMAGDHSASLMMIDKELGQRPLPIQMPVIGQ
ncbi:ferritin [Verrucomicrobiota bacterium]